MSTATPETRPALGATPAAVFASSRTTSPPSWSRRPSCIALIPLVWLLWTVLSKGLHAITRNGWFTQSQRGITYRDPGGGAWHAILGTFLQVAALLGHLDSRSPCSSASTWSSTAAARWPARPRSWSTS